MNTAQKLHSPYSVGYAVANGWLPEHSVPTQQELVKAIRALFDVMPISLLHDAKASDAVARARDLIRRVPA